ncbi:hypothetical protein [Singulisphaera acidiphila]|uniref:Uncharacterized protein n=1 Tax=Singulisphaera acidiphila (strain ATCC BAA-1392 / DSM 18658 / VKM B-2454 / MOB10) TaxID=886293 RepID=L0DMW1_SINAD|nr:hypothetical protein [Singulisphaera acidiphila]AGA30719.1 hypothetical protein Sinac_6644 [Singulisphaera acidiphila DSM 18658]
MTRPTWLSPILPCLALFVLIPVATLGQAPNSLLVHPPNGIDELRTASASWKKQAGPKRLVVDQVCLVPDFATFLEAIATWDQDHYFPILIDDIELSFKFLRAFQPARIVRFPRKAETIPADQVWPRVLKAIGQTWSKPGEKGATAFAGDLVPKKLGATPPGVVLSEPDSPSLAGAVALAAGRFQPLLRWDVEKGFGDVLTNDEAHALAASLESKVADCIPSYNRLGDNCDFVTLAGDWPYRYAPQSVQEGPKAFDDLIGRTAGGRVRWAFGGRLIGTASASVYRAMCSLFLQPKSALLMNTYDEKERNWSIYAMRSASRSLARLLPVTHRSGDRANLTGWHQTFDPVNRSGLVMINSQGEPNRFGLVGGYGLVGDVPQTEPAAVLMIHSFSAADPSDPNTVAGRWLANGAFVFFGSMHEPGLAAFRTPELVAPLIEAGMPLVAAMRQSPYEARGEPWKLVYLGDPLFQVKSGAQPSRLAPKDWPAGALWPRYAGSPQPAADASDDTRLTWAVKTAVAQLQRESSGTPPDNVDEVLTTIQRPQLSPGLHPYFDALLADAMLQKNQPGELSTRFTTIPAAERSPAVQRLLETCQFLMLEHYLKRREFARAERIWSDLIRPERPPDILEQITGRMSVLADTPSHRAEWRTLLIAVGRRLKNTPAEPVIEAERQRIEKIR